MSLELSLQNWILRACISGFALLAWMQGGAILSVARHTLFIQMNFSIADFRAPDIH